MINQRSRYLWAAACLAALPGLAACQRQQSSPPAGDAAAASKDKMAASRPAGTPIAAAAEPFEALTEQAFAGDWKTLDGLIADAGKAVAETALPGDRSALMAQRMTLIGQARSNEDRVGLALAGVEGYRELIESQDPAVASPPIAVSLLDYAGFRYDALSQADPVDWPEMARTVDFARKQWSQLGTVMPSKALGGVMGEALAGMAKAVEQKNPAFARSAAATELALVDLLEEQVPPPGGQPAQ